MSLVPCLGCSKSFTPSGLSHHLTQTKSALCQAAAAFSLPYAGSSAGPSTQSSEYMPGVHDTLDSAGASITGCGVPATGPPPTFEGDFFGTNYTGHELGIGIDTLSTDLDSDITPMQVDSTAANVQDSDVADNEEEAEDDIAEDAEIFEEIRAAQTRNPQSLGTRVTQPVICEPLDATVIDSIDISGRLFTPAERAQAEGHLWARPIIDMFPGAAGAPLPDYSSTPAYAANRVRLDPSKTNIWAPFETKMSWTMAYWAKTRGPSSSAVSELLRMDGLPERLELGYRTVAELNAIIREQLPGRPAFQTKEITIGGEKYDVHLRDVIPCIRALFGNPEFAKHLLVAPERHYKDEDRTIRVYNEMNTGKWWWSAQRALEQKTPGATVIPIIVSSDKTQLTMFRNKSAYPLYLTIGNIPKDIRRKPSRQAQILVGYLPTAKLDHIKNKAARRRALGNLFHACLSHVFAPLKQYSESGLAMASGDAVWRRCHPILATYVGDYPEQILVTCTLTGDSPKCSTRYDQLEGDSECTLHDLTAVLEVFELADRDPTVFHAACREQRLRPIFHPFWEDLPYTNIFMSITPDILHQLYQGVVKHLVTWVSDAKAFGADEIDARCRCMPPNHNARLFTNGLSILSRVSGKEHRDICRILLGLIVDLPLPNGRNPSGIVRAVRGLLDFLYLAQYPTHTTETLAAMEAALRRFHDNRQIFVELGIRTDFNIPKLHELRHYRPSIELFGTTDNCNTEQWERLHIDLTKKAWRNTNTKDAYPQMTSWVELIERMHQHQAFIDWRTAGHPDLATYPLMDAHLHMRLEMTQHPTRRSVSLDALNDEYGAVDFSDALALFVVTHNFPNLGPAARQRRADNTLVPSTPVSTFHKVKFWNHDALHREDGHDERDVIHVRPYQHDKQGRIVPGRFDTALLKTKDDAGNHGVKGFRVGQVRVVFELSKMASTELFIPTRPPPPQHLVYVEWFTPFTVPESDSLMYRVSRSYTADGRRVASVVPLQALQRSVQLFPRFGAVVPTGWTSFNVLDKCDTFRLNPFLDRHSYVTMY